MTYRIAAGLHQGRKVVTLQTLPDGAKLSVMASERSGASPCTLASRPARINEPSANGCVGTLATRPSRESGYR